MDACVTPNSDASSRCVIPPLAYAPRILSASLSVNLFCFGIHYYSGLPPPALANHVFEIRCPCAEHQMCGVCAGGGVAGVHDNGVA